MNSLMHSSAGNQPDGMARWSTAKAWASMTVVSAGYSYSEVKTICDGWEEVRAALERLQAEGAVVMIGYKDGKWIVRNFIMGNGGGGDK